MWNARFPLWILESHILIFPHTHPWKAPSRKILSHKCTHDHKISVLCYPSPFSRFSFSPKTIKTNCRGEERGLSRKHIIESVQASLKRLQLDYIDCVLVHKADSMCPMEGNLKWRGVEGVKVTGALQIWGDGFCRGNLGCGRKWALIWKARYKARKA
jgi:hypothetical protein